MDIFPSLARIPLLNMFLALALGGLALDLRLRLTRLEAGPHLKWAVLFVLWCFFTLGLKVPASLAQSVTPLGVPLVIYLVISHGVQSLRSLQAITGTVLVLVLLLAFIGAHQGFSDFGCIRIDPSQVSVTGVADGRPCSPDNVRDCFDPDVAEPGAEYLCEKVGLLHTHSIGHGRVRYLGTLCDPNELALMVAAGLPLAFGFFERRKSAGRFLLLVGTILLVGTCASYSPHRAAASSSSWRRWAPTSGGGSD
jgi:hypothetical protein